MSRALLRLSDFCGKRATEFTEKFIARRSASALFIPGNKASENFSLLSPHLDFDSRFEDLGKLREELASRGSPMDVDEIAKTWEFYKHINAKKWTLESRRSEIAQRMKKFNKSKSRSDEQKNEASQLITEGKVLRHDLRMIKESLWEMEETVVMRALKLPNEIHEKTPRDSPIVLSSSGEIREPPSDEIRSHLEIGRDLGLVEYTNPVHCYLCDNAALFELGALSLASEILGEAEMLRVAGTDFGRSLVVEGSGMDHEDPGETFVLANNEGIDRATCNRLHLVGGASLVSFLAMHTKQLVNPKDFPVKYYAIGRQYAPFVEGTNANGLFSICQASVAEAFVMTKDLSSEEYSREFDLLTNTITKLYDSLDAHYRIVMRSAGELRSWESLRISYEMWSPNSRRYVEVGHLSMCGQYISKRLLMAYQTPTGRDFPAVITGTVLSVPKLLGCLLEMDSKRFAIPAEIARRMPGFC